MRKKFSEWYSTEKLEDGAKEISSPVDLRMKSLGVRWLMTISRNTALLNLKLQEFAELMCIYNSYIVTRIIMFDVMNGRMVPFSTQMCAY